MNATEAAAIAENFQNSFRELINRSLKSKVPLALMVTAFDDAKLELQLTLLDLRRANAVAQSADNIIQIGEMKLSPNRNGRH